MQTAREDRWLDHFKVKGDMLMENIARLVLIILKGVKMDDKGNVYVADTLNLAIIGDSGMHSYFLYNYQTSMM